VTVFNIASGTVCFFKGIIIAYSLQIVSQSVPDSVVRRVLLRLSFSLLTEGHHDDVHGSVRHAGRLPGRLICISSFDQIVVGEKSGAVKAMATANLENVMLISQFEVCVSLGITLP
jgi:hypothetical protein